MSEASLQLLLHAGELEYIMKTIKATRKNQFAAGCLFGLWRNSLIQPVIQFVTGPQLKEKEGIKEVFRKKYSSADILEEDHRLLHLGFWFYGPDHLRNQGNI